MRRLWKTIQLWFEVDGTFIAAAVSFYAAMALFPLILVLLASCGWLLGGSNYVQELEVQLIDMIADQTSQNFADTVASQLNNIQANANFSGSVSIVTLLAFTVALFANLERGFSKIWQAPKEAFAVGKNLRQMLFHRLVTFLMMVLVIIAVLINFAINFSIEFAASYIPERFNVEYVWWSGQLAASTTLNAILFATVFQIVPRQKIFWRHAIQGGLLTAILWEPGRYLLSTFVISDRYTAFGIVGVFLAVLLWIFYVTITILFGASLVCVVGRDYKDQEESLRD
jgi:membrane protein